MKTLRFSALVLLFQFFSFSAFPLFGANPTVIFQSELLTGRPYTNIVVQFDPLPITLQSNKFIARASVTFTTDWTGSFTNPIVPGAYRVSLGPYTVFTNCIPDTNATIFATDYVCTAATNGFTSAYTRAQSDLRYPSVAGTNITFTTNAGRVVIHAAASGGSGSDTPHSVTDGATLVATNPVALRFTNAGNITFSLVSNAAGVSISATVDLSVTNDLATLAAATYLTNWVNAVSNRAETKQHGSATLTNLSGTGALTNPAAFQPASATLTNLDGNPVKDYTNRFTAGNNITLTTNSPGQVTVSSSASGGGIETNANQFAANTTLNIKDGALLTNVIYTAGIDTSSSRSNWVFNTQSGRVYGDFRCLEAGLRTIWITNSLVTANSVVIVSHAGTNSISGPLLPPLSHSVASGILKIHMSPASWNSINNVATVSWFICNPGQ